MNAPKNKKPEVVLSTLLEYAPSLLSFAYAVSGDTELAEKITLDVLLLGLENEWLSSDEFKPDLFAEVWKLLHAKKINPEVVIIGQEEMKFFKLQILGRAALYLKSRMHYTYEEVADILVEDKDHLQHIIDDARTFVLGKKLEVHALEDW